MREKIIILAVLLLIGAGGYLALKVDKQPDQPTTEIATVEKESTTNTPTTSITEPIIHNQIPMNAIIKTNKGDITIELFADLAPKTVENFTKLAKEGFYDNTKFHRVIKGFMIQAGDPLTKDDTKQNMWGTGGPGYRFEDEIHAQNNNVIGTISMANAGPNTNGSQFFINTADNNFLDPKHTVFGKVTAGMETVAAIESTQTTGPDRPVEPMIITGIELQ